MTGLQGAPAIVRIEALRYVDDPAEAHTLTEAEGRGATERYNAKLAEQINKELGAP